MTIICKKCGSENHLEATKCKSCGEPIKQDEAYLVCGTCGISNPSHATICSGCGESLEEGHAFKLLKENELVEKTTTKKKKEKKPLKVKENLQKPMTKRVAIGAGMVIVLFALTFFTYQWIQGQRLIYEAEEGFSYVTDNGVLHVVDEKGKDTTIAYDVTEADVYKYGDDIYFMDQNDLYYYNKTSVLVHKDVTSFKIHPKGNKVLFTTSNGSVNDLFLLDGEDLIRIDGNVGIDRYIFGMKDEVYYVKDITSDENLGVMYLKKGTDPSEKVVEDVFAPVFSLRKNTVYYVREDIYMAPRFDLYYVKDTQVTEIARNITQVHVNPTDETFYLVQYKNNEKFLLSVMREQATQLFDNVTRVGRYAYDDALPLNRHDELFLMLKINDENTYFENGTSHVLESFDDYLISEDQQSILTYKDSEMIISSFDGTMSNGVSVVRDAELVDLSATGQTMIVKNDQVHVFRNGQLSPLAFDLSVGTVSNDESYLVYATDKDGYVYKFGANEPVFLSSDVTTIRTIAQWVYTIVDGELMRYRLGKFSSNQVIDTAKALKSLNLSK